MKVDIKGIRRGPGRLINSKFYLLEGRYAMKRIVDKHYYTYSVRTAVMSGVYVKCPTCGGLGMVTAEPDTAYFKCTNCGSLKTKERTIYRYDVHNQCDKCGRYYRVDISDSSKQRFPMLQVACTYCGYVMSGKVQKTPKYGWYIGEIKNGCEPFFGFELWFLTDYRGKLVWALNREHLAYLIDYLSADLREKPSGYQIARTQAAALPAFMKTAKNRDGIVKCLKNMQMK